MSRYRPQKSYGHKCRYLGYDWYEIGWAVDRYIKGSRLRWPTRYGRMTDEAGAIRFCKKHDLKMPTATPKEATDG